MHQIIQKIALVFALSLFSFASAAAVKNTTDPNLAWRNYLANDTHIEPSYRFPHANCFKVAALEYDLPHTLLLAVARGESDFEPTARSKANAHGVMQILWPATANHLGIYRLSELYDPCTNIDAGARYLRELTNRYDGNLHLALAAYNYGPERINKNGNGVPSGAEWYSAYIFRHLNYVLGDKRLNANNGEHLYSQLGRSTLVSFGEPYRAQAFVSNLERTAPELRLDWFRKGVGKFAVVLIYENRDDFDKSASLLHQSGFRLDK
jgi:soluble lytic murein transglycosylase-like protein